MQIHGRPSDPVMAALHAATHAHVAAARRAAAARAPRPAFRRAAAAVLVLKLIGSEVGANDKRLKKHVYTGTESKNLSNNCLACLL